MFGLEGVWEVELVGEAGEEREISLGLNVCLIIGPWGFAAKKFWVVPPAGKLSVCNQL